ncbi:MAG: alpha-amylase family glycosyl hydrolase [Lachnospiraceae bacterium]|nr:alpha-amylase family glycosyl hydrolase [Lachnospiraceae bacterium]
MWFEDAVFYHMYPIGMTGVHRVNDVTEVEHHFDDLKKWLPHIRSINANAIYIGPLFESNAHGYDTRDYKIVDRRLGDNEDFKEFVEEAHELGIKVVVDGVFNHTGRDFWAFNDIKEKRENSPYCSWYRGLNFGGNTAYNDGFYYDAWHNCFDLANLNLENEEVRRYLIEDVINFWIDEFDIDGIRLDCADCLPGYFQEEMRRFVDTKKPEFWLMGEVIHGDYNVYVQPNRLDSVTNYELHKALYSGHNDHNYFEIAHSCRREFEENGGMYRDKYLYSFVDNHDVDRLASKLQNKEHLHPIYSLLYTLPGIPSVYYGSEWGIEGRKEGASDDGMRPEVHIEEALKDNPKLMEFITDLGAMRKKYSPLRHGKYRELLLTNRQYAFARIEDDACVITAVNNDENNTEIQIPVPFQDKAYYNINTQEDCPVENGRILLKLAACGSVFIASK